MGASLTTPDVAIVCQTVCPENPPCVGKWRLAVQEILAAKGDQDTLARERDEAEGAEQRFLRWWGAPERRLRDSVLRLPTFHCPAEGQPPGPAAPAPEQCAAGMVVPMVRISKAPAPTFQTECIGCKGSAKDSTHLQIPKWRYKEVKEEKKKAEEAKRKRQKEAQKEKQAPCWRKMT